jgi:hypothetical protein
MFYEVNGLKKLILVALSMMCNALATVGTNGTDIPVPQQTPHAPTPQLLSQVAHEGDPSVLIEQKCRVCAALTFDFARLYREKLYDPTKYQEDEDCIVQCFNDGQMRLSQWTGKCYAIINSADQLHPNYDPDIFEVANEARSMQPKECYDSEPKFEIRVRINTNDEVIARCLGDEELDFAVAMHRLCNLMGLLNLIGAQPSLSQTTTTVVGMVLPQLVDLSLSRWLLDTLLGMDTIVREMPGEVGMLFDDVLLAHDTPAHQTVCSFIARCISDGDLGTIRELLSKAAVLKHLPPLSVGPNTEGYKSGVLMTLEEIAKGAEWISRVLENAEHLKSPAFTGTSGLVQMAAFAHAMRGNSAALNEYEGLFV